MRGRFPWGLTLAAAVAVAICAGLGVWQLQRAGWKAGELARIAALGAAQPSPISAVLARAARGENVDLTRVEADCQPGNPLSVYTFSSDNGQWVARAHSVCRLAAGPYDGILIDRGIEDASRGGTELPTRSLPAPGHVVGILRPASGDAGLPGPAHPPPWTLSVEQETPSVAGVTPSPGEATAPDNLQYVGAYAPTWFGLAAVIAGVYAAMLWRRRA